MSKYMIPMESYRAGEQWLDAMDYTFYLFLSAAVLPGDESRTYIEETYDNKIENCEFGYFRLNGMVGRKVIKEGWALRKKGPIGRYMTWPTGKLEEICQEPVQRIREFETVIVIEAKYGHPPGNCNAGWSYESRGFLLIDMGFSVQRRSEPIKDPGYSSMTRERKYEYYEIPSGESLTHYTPTNKDLIGGHYSGQIIIPYTPEKHEVLNYICKAGNRLGDNLRDLFEKKALEMPAGMNLLEKKADVQQA